MFSFWSFNLTAFSIEWFAFIVLDIWKNESCVRLSPFFCLYVFFCVCITTDSLEYGDLNLSSFYTPTEELSEIQNAENVWAFMNHVYRFPSVHFNELYYSHRVIFFTLISKPTKVRPMWVVRWLKQGSNTTETLKNIEKHRKPPKATENKFFRATLWNVENPKTSEKCTKNNWNTNSRVFLCFWWYIPLFPCFR